ncbi:unnamed protein product [Effrenium voratum]|nr:unnamed protein product [Effrenium voratum]
MKVRCWPIEWDEKHKHPGCLWCVNSKQEVVTLNTAQREMRDLKHPSDLHFVFLLASHIFSAVWILTFAAAFLLARAGLCLQTPDREMVGTLYYVEEVKYKAEKALIAAKFNGLSLKTAKFDAQKDVKKPGFYEKNPTGKVPFLETPYGCISNSNAVARYVARCRADTGLCGDSFLEETDVDQWLDFGYEEEFQEWWDTQEDAQRRREVAQREQLVNFRRLKLARSDAEPLGPNSDWQWTSFTVVKRELLTTKGSSLSRAAVRGNVATVISLLEVDDEGRTPMQLAAYNGHHQILRWLLEAGADKVETPLMTWLYPVLGLMENQPAAASAAQEDVKKALAAMETHLAQSAFLAAEKVTLADIVLVCILKEGFLRLFDPAFRKPFPKLCQWFQKCCSMSQFKTVLGELQLCEKMQGPSAVAPKKAKETKEEPKKAEPKEAKKAEPKKEAKKAEPKAEPKAQPAAGGASDAEVKAAGDAVRALKDFTL